MLSPHLVPKRRINSRYLIIWLPMLSLLSVVAARDLPSPSVLPPDICAFHRFARIRSTLLHSSLPYHADPE